MVKVIVADKIHDSEHLLGMFVDESHYDVLIEEDTDCYLPADCDAASQANCETDRDCSNCSKGMNEARIAFKFRKNFFTKEEQDNAYAGLREAAVRTENRGLASGIKEGTSVTGEGREWVTNYQEEMIHAILSARTESLIEGDVIEEVRSRFPTQADRLKALGSGKNNVWVISRFRNKFNFDEFIDSIIPLDREKRATEMEEVMKMISETSYGNPVDSGIAGWYDRYPRIPYGRATTYTRDNFEKFQLAYPFLQTLAKGFKDLLPWRYNNQMEAAKKLDPRYLVPGTPFTTITVNKTFRTAAHRDAGDLDSGLSNLLTLSNDGRYTGGYLIFPEVRIAVNVRPGDLLLVNNHEVIHGNTPIVCEEGSERISLVCYFREKMLELGTHEYEDARYRYVESRRLNKEHPMWKKLWNGVSPGMWDDAEWYDFLRKQPNGDAMVAKYHPDANNADLGDLGDEWFA
jgi:hypothetical protein